MEHLVQTCKRLDSHSRDASHGAILRELVELYVYFDFGECDKS